MSYNRCKDTHKFGNKYLPSAYKTQVDFRSHFSGKTVRLIVREIRYVILTTLPLQQWLHECTLLCYTYITILFLRNKPVCETNHSPLFNTKDKIVQSFSHHCPLLAFSYRKRFAFYFIKKIVVLDSTMSENSISFND